MTIIRTMIVDDANRLQRQASQRVQLGVDGEMTEAQAAALIMCGEAWTAERGDRVIACMGIAEQYAGRQGVAWAILADDVGTSHLAITRHARARIAASPLVRIEAYARAHVPAECKWPQLLGLMPAHVLYRYGAASEDHILFERIR